MRKLLVMLAIVGVAVLAAAGAAGGDRTATRVTATRVTATRVSVPGRLSVRVPAGWHVLRGWLSDVIDPAPRLAVASFPARLSRHTCECGFPNVVSFPRGGAFVFVWEYLHPSHNSLAHIPSRPARFPLTEGGRVRMTCEGPTDTFAFKDDGRFFQVEVYIGPAARPALRGQVAAMLDGVAVAPHA